MLIFDEALDTDRHGVGGAVAESNASVQSVAFDANDAMRVVLTLGAAVAQGESGITVGYTEPAEAATHPLKYVAGNRVASFADQVVTNATPDTTKPTLESASVDGTALTLTFDEALDTRSSAPAAGAFTLSVAESSASVRDHDLG